MIPNQNDQENFSRGEGAENSRTENIRNRENSNPDENEDFPGYPHYPSKEDIMHPANKMEKVAPDPEKLTRSGAYLDPKSLDKPVSSSLDTSSDLEDDDLMIVPGTEADVTKEDLMLLGEQFVDADEEESIDSKILSGDIGGDLDVPGEELDDENEEIGEEDEENNYYSLGSDSKENLEESA